MSSESPRLPSSVERLGQHDRGCANDDGEHGSGGLFYLHNSDASPPSRTPTPVSSGTLEPHSSASPVPTSLLSPPTSIGTPVAVPGISTLSSPTDPRLVISPFLMSIFEILYCAGATIKGSTTSGPSFETGQFIQNLAMLASGAVSEVARLKGLILKEYPFSGDAVHRLSTCRELPIAKRIPAALTIPLVDNSLPWSSVAALSNNPIPYSPVSQLHTSHHQPVIARSAFASLPARPTVPPPSPIENLPSIAAIPMSPASSTGATIASTSAHSGNPVSGVKRNRRRQYKPKVRGLADVPVASAPQLTASWVENQRSGGPFPNARIEFDPRSSSYRTVSHYRRHSSD
ncbi:hypothetical protein GYMLUDRAFT_987513 [Collybiopsis luxurians FD-317 M1]|uniref:Uncharacterized protein n=1 Tax=Collybiopsis luxurians FD-317 M1 TaxID=944289 RepID=A0A0D0C734_9AGAR|nr:hypothetical protein GYMLUDRAFT_987513 [Collybiopsis luxurians FD-317 M1]